MARDALTAIDEIASYLQNAVDYAPERPGNTCPDIDDAIKTLRHVRGTIEDAVKELDANGLHHRLDMWGSWDLGIVIDALEELRKANHALRVNGTHFYEATVQALRIAESVPESIAQPEKEG